MLTGSASAQIWTEDFTFADGTTVGPSGKWTATCPACVAGDYFEVRSNALAARDVNDWAIWESEVIDISGCSDVSFSVLAQENGDHDGPGCACGINIDYLDIYYRVNAGTYQIIENWNGDGATGHTLTGDSQNGLFTDNDWVSTTVSQGGLSGTSLQLRVELRNTAGSEELVIDDLVVLCTPLPVEMMHLDAYAGEDAVEIEWETARESGSSEFWVERSPNGTSFWTIGEVAAAGNSDGPTRYQFTDAQPLPGRTFYRLRQVDQDGSFSYTRVVEVDAQAAPLEVTELYPNPASDQLHLRLRVRSSDPAGSLEVYDARGNLAYTQNLSLRAGETDLEIPVRELAAGMYLLRVRSGNEVITDRFVVR
ncbi:MAG: T9SS type A sorting domain-containing protein [Bacteroidota bacterium]